jgi:hypothetical protein
MRTPIPALAAAAAAAAMGLTATAPAVGLTATGPAVGLTATAAAQPTGHLPGAHATTAAARGSSSKTVTGPRMYDPTTGGTYPPSSVTVTQTKSLVNQMVQVSWTNFTPSGQTVYNNQNVAYPVMVTECKGLDPSTPADCYGAENGGVTSTSGQYGPMNDAYATTGPATGQDGGSGLTDILILTSQENSFLGCDQSHPCSLAIVPAQGGKANVTPPDCADHSADLGPSGNATGGIAFNAADWACAWAKRTVLPLHFARNPNNCPINEIHNPAFSAAGSPMLDRAMLSWITGLCTGSHGMYFLYDPLIPEPEAIADVGTGQADVALTTRTASAQGISTGGKPVVYAPVAVSAMSAAYWFDNPVTGQPVTNVKLDERLVLKLLTQSYAYENDGCPPAFPHEPYGCDNGVDHNWFNLFQDPEFLQLNPEYAGRHPDVYPPTASGIEIPTVQSGQSDSTWTVTRWIAANKVAREFLGGKFDRWGMHVNTHYLGMRYPTNTFIAMDPYIVIAHFYNPVFPLIRVAQYQAENWYPATEPFKNPQTGNYDDLPPQVPGQRALIAIVDEGDSAAFLFPTAALRNGAGRDVRPTSAGLAAAVKTMIPAGDGTLQVNLHSANPAVYPLTMVIYAMVPTSGLSHAKAAAIARFIDYTAGAGQHPGLGPGQLPPGFLPLTAKLRAQARKAAQEIRHQTGQAGATH